MKVVIIGAGIAGLTLALFLEKYGIQVSLNERALGTPGGGYAFLMHQDGLRVLDELAEGRGLPLPGQVVQRFSLKSADGGDLQEAGLGAWHCMKRDELSGFLCGLLQEPVQDGRLFSHFVYENEKIVAAAFENGELEYGDLFIGADGGASRVRSQTLGAVDFQPGGVKELVGIAQHPAIAQAYEGVFSKFQQQDRGLAFGMIPTSGSEVVWFIQYNPALADLDNLQADTVRAFCFDLLAGFPAVVHEVLRSNDFGKTYLWNTRDFDLLPAFHHQNVAVIGDAAHLALPFTSAGTTNAMVDAQVLAGLLKNLSSVTEAELAFVEFHRMRAHDVKKHVAFGRRLRDTFLNPGAEQQDAVVVPLI